MGRNLVICLNLHSAILGSKEPLRFEDGDIQQIVTLLKPEHDLVKKLFTAPSVEMKTKDLPRLMRQLLLLLCENKQKDILIHLIDACTWALEKGNSVCMWDDGVKL